MSHVPTVSVILPTYNRAPTLGRSIESVLGQAFDDLELFVIDDGSEDSTCSLLDSYGKHPQVRIFRNNHAGCSAARNCCLVHATGRHIAFQDSDDEWLPNKLAIAVETLERADSETAVFYSPMIEVCESGEQMTHHPPEEIIPGKLIIQRV